MRETKVVRLLSCFSPDDLAGLKDFVASPLFNKDEQMSVFLDLLLPHLPGAPEATALVHDLFPEQPEGGEKRLDRLKHRLVVLIREYIDFRARYRPEGRHFHALARLEEWWERGEEKAHEKEIAALEEALSHPHGRSSLDHWHRFRLAGHLAAHAPHYDRPTRMQRLQQVWQSIDSLQRLQKLRYLCVLVNQVRITGRPMPDWLQHELGTSAQLHDPADPLSRLYRLCLDMQLEPGREERYQAFMNALSPAASGLSPEEARDLFQYAVNFQIRRFNRLQDEAAAEAIRRLYQTLLDTGLLLENGAISAWNYKNIVSLMARIGALDWLDRFMDTHEPFIRFDYADNAANFCRGQAAFYRKDYRETARRMEAVLSNFRNVFWGLEARALLLQAHYERGHHEDLETVYHSARMYVGRTAGPEVSEDHQAGYRNFNRFVYKLSRIVTGDRDRRGRKLRQLQDSIRRSDLLPNKSWLLARVEAEMAD